MTRLKPYRRVAPFAIGVEYACRIVFGLPLKSMTGFSRSANGQGHAADDGANGHVTFSCLEVVVAAEDVTSVTEKEMSGRSESSFGSGMSRACRFSAYGCVERRLRGRCRLRFLWRGGRRRCS